MDIILLPVVNRATQPTVALRIMKESRRSVAAVGAPAAPIEGLINSVEVRKAKNGQMPDLSQASLMPVAVLHDGDFAAEGYDRLKLPTTSVGKVREHLLQTFLGAAHRELTVRYEDLPSFQGVLPPTASYALLGFDRGAAVVMTLHEGYAAQAGTPPADCCCRNPVTPHEYPAGRKKDGGTCDLCTYTVEC